MEIGIELIRMKFITITHRQFDQQVDQQFDQQFNQQLDQQFDRQFESKNGK